nr:hypothetical protein Iba_chr07dCG8070 [Ipomoea batatas]
MDFPNFEQGIASLTLADLDDGYMGCSKWNKSLFKSGSGAGPFTDEGSNVKEGISVPPKSDAITIFDQKRKRMDGKEGVSSTEM